MYSDPDYTDEEAKIIEELDYELKEYIVENYLSDFLAFYLYKCNNCKINVLIGNLQNNLNSGIEMFCQITSSSINVNEVKHILKKKYKLSIKSSNPTELEESK